MKKEKFGNLFKINLPGNKHSYCWYVPPGLFIFFDFYSDEDLPPDKIVKLPKLFAKYVHKYVFTKSSWILIGNIKPADNLTDNIRCFRQDIADLNECWIEDVNGKLTPATPEECIGLERSSVSDFEFIEQRLSDHYNNIENRHVTLMKVKLPLK